MYNLLFGKKRKPSNVLVIGCNRAGSALAESFSAKGYNITVIDKEIDSFEKLPACYIGNSFHGDITDADVMEEVSVREADLVLVMTSSDVLNMFISEIILKRYKNEIKIVARLNDISKKEAYQLFEIETVCMESIFSNSMVESIEFSKKDIE